MPTHSIRRVSKRFAMAAGFALTLSACAMAVEQPPRAMFGTAAWSDAWKVTCSDVDPSATQLRQVGYEHLYSDCQQYQVAQRLRYQQPLIASNEAH